MKKIMFFFTKKDVWKRAVAISDIRKMKEYRMRTAIIFMHQWDDIPFDEILEPTCSILGIKPTEESKNYIKMLSYPTAHNIEIVRRHIPA